jgi:hypothetical protein
MGGRALNGYNVHTERKNTAEFNKIGVFFQQRLFEDLKIITSMVKCYRNKETHGDLDLLIKITESTNINWVDYIGISFKPRAIYANGGVYSFDYENFQIDFIPIREDKWDMAQIYFSYDPLGNIMGKTYHKFGLSYGWEGLRYKFRGFSGTTIKDILISMDPRKIFEFGGYDYDRYLQEFDTLEDIFQFCINGKYFDTEMFKIENLKSIDKKRNRRRGSYHLFLNYLNEMNNVHYQFNQNKTNYLSIINDYFPEANLKSELVELTIRDLKKEIISEKFNGDIVMSWIPDLRGKELGQAIGNFKNDLGDEYDDFIYNSNPDEIHKKFMELYNK